MATFTVINTKTQSGGRMAAAVQYAKQEEKTRFGELQLVTGHNCVAQNCLQEMAATKERFQKTDGVHYYHFVQSFSDQEEVGPREAHQIALELAQELFPDHEALVATHIDTDNIHSHIIVNSVSFKTGKKLHQNRSDLVRQRQVNDEICQQHQLQILPTYVTGRRRIKPGEYRAAERGDSWKFRLMWQIDQAMRLAADREQFIQLMEMEGYQVKWTDDRKNITYTTPEGLKCRDNKLHEDKYLKARMEHEFQLRMVIHGGIERIEPAEVGKITADERGSGGHDRDHRGHVLAAAGDIDHPATASQANQSGPDATDFGTDISLAAGDFTRAETGWEQEREAYFAAQYQVQADTNQLSPPPPLDPVLGSLVHHVADLAYAVERLNDAPPVVDSTTRPPQIDRKERQRLREKKQALGHKDDDTEQTQSWQQQMY